MILIFPEGIEYLEMKHPELLTEVAEKKVLTDEWREKMNQVLETFIANFKVEE